MPKDANKGFVASLADGPAFVVVDAVSGAVKKLRASVLAAAFAPSSHVGAGGAAHAVATTGAAGFMSAADKTKVDTIQSGPWAPTASDPVNIAAIVSNGGYWQRVGDMMRVWLQIAVTATSTATYCRITLTLPAGATAAAFQHLVGGVTGTDALLSRAAPGSAGTIVFSWKTNTTTSQNAWLWADIWVGP